MLQRTNIYLDPNILNFLKRRANQKGITMAEFVRDMLKQGVEKERNQQSSSWVQSLLKSSQNAGKSGLKDVARRHDYYLYQKYK